MKSMSPIGRTPRRFLAFAFLPLLALAPGGCGTSPARTTGSAVADAGSADALAAGSSAWPPAIDPRAFGVASLASVTVAAFSQTGVSAVDPQVLTLGPDIVPRAWGQWDTSGLNAGDYTFGYPASCKAQGITFVGGLTASVIFMDQMSATDFSDAVGRDATGTPVAHSEIVAGAYRGALASPVFRQTLIHIAELQIDGGVDGLFFDEVNSSYIGTNYGGDEGFDDHDVADFGRFLCAKHAGNPSAFAPFNLLSADHLDCSSSDPGASFDYRGYLARHCAQGLPLGAANPLSAEWGTTVQNRPDPAQATFVETYPSLVYWQAIVVAVRSYARQKYNKEILITANGIFPFVDFQSVGLYDWNKDGAGPRGFDYVPVTGAAPDPHYDGTVSFLPVFASLKARSARIQQAVGGAEIPLLLFLDWPTDSMNRYYALPLAERQDYVRMVLAEAYAMGEWFAMPLATTTDTSTATALGMMDFFGSMRAFYKGHEPLLAGARDSTASATVSTPGVSVHLTTLPDGRSVLHLINHNYAAGFVPQTGLMVTVPRGQAPTSVTLASPDLPADAGVPFTSSGGTVSVSIDTLRSSMIVVVD